MFFFLISIWGYTQNDTIQLKNNNVLAGEIKSISKGVLTFKTSYSDKDFKIKFHKVKGLVVQRKCLVILTRGRRRFGNIKTDNGGNIIIRLEDNSIESFNLDEVITLDEVDDNFWSRIKGSIDLGYNFTKANNNSQFTIGGNLNYVDKRWLIEGDISVLNSRQDNADKTKRTDANLEFIRILPRKWYLLGNIPFLANTEQALEGRINPGVSFGKFLISTNKLYLGLSVGLTYNIEEYADESLNKTSSEALLSTSFNMFDFEDINLKTDIKLYSSLSEKKRTRVDYDVTLKYDLPLDFYLKLGFTLNYDNQPAIAGNDIDYIFTSGFGWVFD